MPNTENPQQDFYFQPDWPTPAGVMAAMSVRSGGISQGPYQGLNLGGHVGDQASAVQGNRSIWQSLTQCHTPYLTQVHSCNALQIGRDTPDGCEADAAWTHDRGVACTVLVADCLPVLLCDTRDGGVAAAHAGWRGLAGHGGRGILEALRPLGAAHNIMAWLGPCIGPLAFEVGAEVRQAFVAAQAGAAVCFQPAANGKWLADLPALARLRLKAMGIQAIYGNDSSPEWCTVHNASRFYSFRRDRVCGRMAASIWRVD